MLYTDYGLRHISQGETIEKVSLTGLELSLLSSYDGTEVIHHRLLSGSRWVIGPSEGWDGLEFIYVLSGEMTCDLEERKITMKSGDTLSAVPIKKDCFFQAIKETEFLYITSRPVFHHYSEVVQRMRDLAISVEEKDGYTADHCNRIMNLSMLLGERMNLSPNELYQLNLGSFLHDIGKIKIPDHILNKPGSLTAEEWMVMKKHPSFGGEILEETNLPYLIAAASIVEQHHERYNGSGYPRGLQKEEISIAAAIVAVVDSYDAMTTDRVYRKGLSKEEAMIEILNGRASLYHPEVVDHFVSIVTE